VIGLGIEFVQFGEMVLPGSLAHREDLAKLDGDCRSRFIAGRAFMMGGRSSLAIS